MRKEKIYKIIVRYLNNEISKEEEAQLLQWIEKPENKKELEEYISMNYFVNKHFIKFKGKISSEEFLNNIKSTTVRKSPNFFFKFSKYAAVVVLLLAFTYFLTMKKDDDQNIERPIIVNNVKIGTDKATLTLDDGTDLVLEKEQDYITDNFMSNGKELVYNSSTNSESSQSANEHITTYNYLTIPRGGQYFVKLSDGTQVWLNSESKLKYPVSFIDGETRTVQLIYGEAYFKVSPSTNHQGSKFKVQTDAQEIEVLGTEFNIKAYKDESFIYTTLIEGKVAVHNTHNYNVLSPNQQTALNLGTNKFQLLTVDDIYSITAWKEGVFSFEDTSLTEIMKVLSRWYDTDVIFVNKETEKKKFTGILDKNQSIEKILSTIYSTNNLNYQINNKTIIFR
ncbi:FecR domain-containing protein [Seonamhaeicola sp.]|uniref:FecR family protein n=1 Tax=Seonamhaeicola sp. TaxID=1912245 RepID=UPI002608F4AD|nr:FecR domain-containing protein [Seonamhaeicola sp.]